MPAKYFRILSTVVLAAATTVGCSSDTCTVETADSPASCAPTYAVIDVQGDNSMSAGTDLIPRHTAYLTEALTNLDGLGGEVRISYRAGNTDTRCGTVAVDLPDRMSGSDPDWVDAANSALAQAQDLMDCAAKTQSRGSFVFDPALVDEDATAAWVMSDGLVFDSTARFTSANLSSKEWVESTAAALVHPGALDGVEVTWFGLGRHADLDRVQFNNLQAFWTRVIEQSGGTVRFMTDEPLASADSA